MNHHRGRSSKETLTSDNLSYVDSVVYSGTSLLRPHLELGRSDLFNGRVAVLHRVMCYS